MYINPDDIARELNPENPVAVQIQAGKETLKRIDALWLIIGFSAIMAHHA